MSKTKRNDDAYLMVAIPDCHAPAHDVRALAAICRWMETRWVDALVQVGDAVDHESISRFVKESPKKLADGHLLEEWAIGRSMLTRLVAASRKRNPDCLYFQEEGNHETRVLRMQDQFPMLRGMFDLKTHLGVEANGGRWVACDSEGEVLRFEQTRNGIRPIVLKPTDIRTEIYFGATVLHGWRYNMHNAKATADLSPWPGITLYGHTHTRQIFTADKWGQDKTLGASIGWVGLPYPEYAKARPNRWEQAFAITHIHRDIPGELDLLVPRIRNGMFIGPDGKVYSGDK